MNDDIFDPILVAAFLIREKYIDRNIIGMNENEMYADLVNFDNMWLQSVVDFVIEKVKSHVSSNESEGSMECEYVGVHKVKIPIWYLKFRGHDLETILKQIFPQLNKHQGEATLKREIIAKVEFIHNKN